MGTAWRVHTWQLNIGVGDSAIHLLVDEKDSLGGMQKPVVQRAVLIDGGENMTSGEKIANAITMIERQYAFPVSANGQLRFDSIVITHWDSDHYQGIQGLLEEDYARQVKNDPTFVTMRATTRREWKKDMLENGAAPLPADADVDTLFAAKNYTPLDLVTITDTLLENGKGPWEYVEPLDTRITIRSRYMKYGPAYPQHPTFVRATNVDDRDLAVNPVVAIPLDQLLTTVYVPYRTANNLVGPPSVRNNLSMSSNLDGEYEEWQDRRPTDRTNRNWMSCDVPMEFDGEAPFVERTGKHKRLSFAAKNVQNARPKTWQILYCCKISADWQDYLGAELFFGIPCPARYNDDQVKNPAQLLKLSSLLQTDGPRMYCVAGDQVILGNLPLAQFAAFSLAEAARTGHAVVTSPGRSTLTGPSLQRVGPVRHVIDPNALSLSRRWEEPRTDSHQKNSASLVCVVLASKVTDWTAVAAAQMRHSFRVLLYTAGDALFDEEGAVVSWLRNRTEAWTVQPVSVVKVSQ
jgi:hypothetical protein